MLIKSTDNKPISVTILGDRRNTHGKISDPEDKFCWYTAKRFGGLQ